MELPFLWGHLHLNGELRELKCSRGAQGQKALITGNCSAYAIVLPHLEYSPGRDKASSPLIYRSSKYFQFLHRKPCLSPQHGFKVALLLLLFKWQEANFRQKIFNSSKFSWNLFRGTEGLSTGSHFLLSPKGIDGLWGTVMIGGISCFHACFVGRM